MVAEEREREHRRIMIMEWKEWFNRWIHSFIPPSSRLNASGWTFLPRPKVWVPEIRMEEEFKHFQQIELRLKGSKWSDDEGANMHSEFLGGIGGIRMDICSRRGLARGGGGGIQERSQSYPLFWHNSKGRKKKATCLAGGEGRRIKVSENSFAIKKDFAQLKETWKVDIFRVFRSDHQVLKKSGRK